MGRALSQGVRPGAPTIPGSRCGHADRTIREPSTWTHRPRVLGGVLAEPAALSAYPAFMGLLRASGLHSSGDCGFWASACSNFVVGVVWTKGFVLESRGFALLACKGSWFWVQKPLFWIGTDTAVVSPGDTGRTVPSLLQGGYCYGRVRVLSRRA